jgi:hypothetical protein
MESIDFVFINKSDLISILALVRELYPKIPATVTIIKKLQ